uniref:Teleost multiple tissue opsin 2b n=1 Tax=Amphiprion percula TaxID=161767 RepID=A0A3P8SDB5_AMPPE
MFSGQAGLNYSFNLSDDRELVDAPAGTAKLSPTGFVVLSVVLGFIMTFGFLNNFVVLLLFCKFKKLRTPVNMLLLNISVSDMLVCLFGTTLSFASSIRGKWLLGRSGCSWYGFINSCFGIVSLISLVSSPTTATGTLTVYNKRGPDTASPVLAVGGSWLGAGTSCSVSWTVNTAHVDMPTSLPLPLSCLGPTPFGFYDGPFSSHHLQVGKVRKTAARRREYHILFMVLTTAACYLLCWMPYGVVAMMATFGPPNIISPVASVVPSLLAKSSTVINPLIYILMNKKFYRCFLILFHCDHWSSENGNTSMPSKTTVIHLNRRVYSNTVACTAQVSTDTLNRSFPTTKHTTPPEVTT